MVRHHLEEFVRYFKWVLVSRDEFERLKSALRPIRLQTSSGRRGFIICSKCAFGGRMDGNPSFGYAAVRGPKLNLLRIEEQLSAAHLRLARVYVECLPYHEVIKSDTTRRPRFYVDPPYWDCENYYGKGLFCP